MSLNFYKFNITPLEKKVDLVEYKAKEVFEKYKDHFVVKATPCDVYVAINAFYHDLCKVLKSWFGSNIDEKVILLAITFWFKDDDYQGNKLMNYFE